MKRDNKNQLFYFCAVHRFFSYYIKMNKYPHFIQGQTSGCIHILRCNFY